MSTANQVSPMEIVRPLADGIIVLSMVSAMASIMAMATSTTVGAAGIHTMGSFMPYVGGGGKKQPTTKSFSSSQEDLDSLNERIRKLGYRLEIQQEAVRGTREHKIKLMQEYGLGVLPSVVEMRKYPKLKATDYYLAKGEKDLDRMEVSMMFLRKKRKDMQIALGIRPEEGEDVRRVYPATKKFIPPTERRY